MSECVSECVLMVMVVTKMEGGDEYIFELFCRNRVEWVSE